eukprot:TRINITY_DN20474_c0_g1_i1.p1 TRINITY_DN20474_c0_g1~~TRINITY_DN20474_c0_g1_i1.p1  ORF type:complete len:389 (-),score=114.48 TRINITY_DN20474_c0_g1_i1:177-1343(-)
MASETSPVLEAQKKAHPELGELVDELQDYASKKLYHQLTTTLLRYLQSPPFHPSKAGSDAELREVFTGFVKSFEHKFDKVRWVQILAIVSKPQTPESALELIAPFEESLEKERDANFMCMALKAEKLVQASKMDEAKEVLESLGSQIDAAYDVDAVIQSSYHKTNALMWKTLERPQEYFKSSLLYLAFTKLEDIPAEDRPKLAFDIGVAALVAAEEFEFGELLQKELLGAVDGTEYAWIKEVLQAYGEGKFEMYDSALKTHRAKIDATPVLKNAESTVLRPKMAVLALMELAFRKPKKQRRLSFEELAQHCRVELKQVEHLVMKAMSAKLVCGSIDEVQQIVIVTWVKPRILDTVRIDLLKTRMDQWAEKTGLLLGHLEEITPELLVS